MFRSSAALLVALVCLLLTAPARAIETDPAVGVWLGTVDVQVAKLRLGFTVTSGPTGELAATLNSIDQGNTEVPVASIRRTGDELSLDLPAIAASFRGTIAEKGDSIEGTWKQGPQSLPLVLERVDRLPGVERPQEPKGPLPYKAEEVTFGNPWADEVTLAGTLTLPDGPGPHPAVVLISGSGPQDRDESLMGHKPFLVLADALTRRGIAVLRYDDRGFGESTGDHSQATSKDLATDAAAAGKFLTERADIDASRIGLCGHSEGGLVAPMVAAKFPDKVAFMVLIAPPGVPGDEILRSQGEAVEPFLGLKPVQATALTKMRNTAIELAMEGVDDAVYAERLKPLVEEAARRMPDSGIEPGKQVEVLMKGLEMFRTPWFEYFLGYDPAKALRLAPCPVLAVIGEKDLQVLPDLNLPPLREALAASPSGDVTVEELPELNHLLQTADTGFVSEYSQIEETIAPSALKLIGDWVVERFGDR